MSRISVITTTLDGQILSQIGDDCYDLSRFDIAVNRRQLISNILDKNYIVLKTHISIEGRCCYQYILEEWRINMNSKLLPNNKVKSELLIDINSFTDFEKEIMYALLNGYTLDKTIEQFIIKLTNNKLKGNIRYGISSLYLKFNCENRTTLIEMLKAYGIDSYLPRTMFPAGIYEL